MEDRKDSVIYPPEALQGVATGDPFRKYLYVSGADKKEWDGLKGELRVSTRRRKAGSIPRFCRVPRD